MSATTFMFMTLSAEIIYSFKILFEFAFFIFKIWMVQTESHVKFSKIKVVDLEIYNFYVHDFFIWHHLVFENLVWTSHFFEIEILNCTNKVTWKVFQNKSCRSCWDLQLLCPWLFHLTSFGVWKSCLNFSFFEIQILNCTNKVTWKVFQNKTCRSWWVL